MQKFIPQKNEKEVISIRISSATLYEIDTLANAIDISRNDLMNQCIDFALQNLDTECIRKKANK